MELVWNSFMNNRSIVKPRDDLSDFTKTHKMSTSYFTKPTITGNDDRKWKR